MTPDDLSTLEVLDENTIVDALKERFQKDDYYVSMDLIYLCLMEFPTFINWMTPFRI